MESRKSKEDEELPESILTLFSQRAASIPGDRGPDLVSTVDNFKLWKKRNVINAGRNCRFKYD